MTTHTRRLISHHFSSLRHAQILCLGLVISLLRAGNTFAQLNVDTSDIVRNNRIWINKIFLSSDGISTGSNSSIILDGISGDVTIKGKVRLSNPSYKCGLSDECALMTDAAGIVSLTGIVEVPPVNSGGALLFTKKGSTEGLNTGAYDISFGNPLTLSGGLASYIKVRVGITNIGSSQGNALIVRGPIESRKGFEVNTPTDITQIDKLNMNDSLGITRSKIYSSPRYGKPQSLKIQSDYMLGGNTSESYTILKSSDNIRPSKVGINTPLGQLPTEAGLEVIGDTIIRNKLTVGYHSTLGSFPVTIRTVGPWFSLGFRTIPHLNRCDDALYFREKGVVSMGCGIHQNTLCDDVIGCVPCTDGVFTGKDYGSYNCYDINDDNKARIVSVTTTNSKAILSAETIMTNSINGDYALRGVGINTDYPLAGLDIQGKSIFDGPVKILSLDGIMNNDGMTSFKLGEIDDTEITPYEGKDMCCKALSVDTKGNIVLVKLPESLCTLSVACGGVVDTSCPANTYKVGDKCIPIPICPAGQYRDGVKCVKIPEVCPAGQYRDGVKCVINNDECPAGSTRDGTQCIQGNYNRVVGDRGICIDNGVRDIGSWGDCIAGNRNRTIVCKNTLGNTIPDNECPSPKPTLTQACVIPHTPVNGSCGIANGVSTYFPNAANLCSVGTASNLGLNNPPIGPWYWSCDGINGGLNASCTAPKTTIVGAVSGLCGGDNGQVLSSSPTDLCAIGLSTLVLGNNPRNWTCQGTNGGANASCATIAPICTNYTCPTSLTLTGDTDGNSIPNCIRGAASAAASVWCNGNANVLCAQVLPCDCDTGNQFECDPTNTDPNYYGGIGTLINPYVCQDIQGNTSTNHSIKRFEITPQGTNAGDAVCGSPIVGSCGSADGTTTSDPSFATNTPASQLCNMSTPSAVVNILGESVWRWSCNDNRGINVYCSANINNGGGGGAICNEYPGVAYICPAGLSCKADPFNLGFELGCE